MVNWHSCPPTGDVLDFVSQWVMNGHMKRKNVVVVSCGISSLLVGWYRVASSQVHMQFNFWKKQEERGMKGGEPGQHNMDIVWWLALCV